MHATPEGETFVSQTEWNKANRREIVTAMHMWRQHQNLWSALSSGLPPVHLENWLLSIWILSFLCYCAFFCTVRIITAWLIRMKRETHAWQIRGTKSRSAARTYCVIKWRFDFKLIASTINANKWANGDNICAFRKRFDWFSFIQCWGARGCWRRKICKWRWP